MSIKIIFILSENYQKMINKINVIYEIKIKCFTLNSQQLISRNNYYRH